MEETNMNLRLLEDYLKDTEITGDDKLFIKEIARLYNGDNRFMYAINKLIISGTGKVTDNAKKVIASTEDGYTTIAYNQRSLQLDNNKMVETISAVAGIMQDILPLGSAVEIDKELFKQILPEAEKVDSIKVVIISRFLCKDEGKLYFPYAGYIYPIGATTPPAIIHFSDNLISKVLKKGYRDDQEDAYVAKMKADLILEGKMKEFDFGNANEVKDFSELIKGNLNRQK